MIKRFTKADASSADQPESEANGPSKSQLLHETPKTPEELIILLEKIQKDA